MCASILGFQAPLLRSVADQLGLPPVSEVARSPGVREVYRFTVHYYDGRACNSVATLTVSPANGVQLANVYQRALLNKPLSYAIDNGQYQAFVKAVMGIHFDKLPDQPNLPTYNLTDLWMIERAAGTFLHSVILAPEQARDEYSMLVNAVRHGLPEALRVVK